MYDRLFQMANYSILSLFSLICVYPFYYIFIYSISTPVEAYGKGIVLLPAGFTLETYALLLSQNDILSALLVSVSRAAAGTIITVFCCAMFSYILTKKQYGSIKALYRLVVITLYLNPGLIPWYLTMKFFGLNNQFLLYVLPSAIVAFFIILVKTYMESIPIELEESATIDGAGYMRIFLRLIFPLSLPILATIAIFSAVYQWNRWDDNFFLVSNPNLQTLQLLLMNYLTESERLAHATTTELELMKNVVKMTPSSIRMTITIIVTMPILFVYPFFQKYFVKGIMVGAIKG